MTETHPDLAALLAAVYAEPGSDMARLLYAERLDELHPGACHPRAELIRVQCELAERERARAAGIQNSDVARAVWLHDRERDLLAAHWSEWLPRFIDRNPCYLTSDNLIHWRQSERVGEDVVLEFVRGFIGRVTLTLGRFVGEACGRCQPATPGMRFGFGTEPPMVKCEVCHGSGRVGPVCPRCHGSLGSGWQWQGDARVTCHACSGTGRLPVLGPRLVRAVPTIEEVGFTDRKPYHNAADCWLWGRTQSLGRSESSVVPDYLFLRLKDYRWDRHHNSWRAYPAERSAILALSDAALGWARGLPQG